MNKEFILSESERIYPEIIQWRRHIHLNPELSFQEFKTADYIRTKLKEFGIDYKVVADTGTVALIGKGEPCVALRADIDALPILEETELEFSSLNEGIMHACGHDMHTSMLLAAAKILKSNEAQLNGTVKLIFQPAEEKIPGGAIMMIKEGVLDNPKPNIIFAQHIYPEAASGTISLTSGPVLASADELYLTVEGKGAHAAQPHLGHDAVLASAQIINYFQSLITKFRNPLHAGVLSVTSIHGGSATNIFPEEVKMMGTLRAYNEVWREDMHRLIKEQGTKIADLYNCRFEVEIMKGYPPVVNDKSASDFTFATANEIVGSDKVFEFEPKMWAEDFAYFAKEIPACFWLLGVKPKELPTMPPLHNPKLNPHEEAMMTGASMMVYSAVKFIQEYNNRS